MQAASRPPHYPASESNDVRFIQPCPFSKGYRIAVASAWQSLLVYECYRLALAGIMLWLFYTMPDGSILGKTNAQLFQIVAIVYMALVVVNGVTAMLRRPGYALQAQMQIFIDIIAIGLLSHASGGPQSGLSILLVVAMAASGLLIGGRCAMVFAALASSAVLGEQLYMYFAFVGNGRGYTYAGLQGAAYFAIALLAFVAAKRTEQSDALARQHGDDLTNLRQLNEYIVQHLQSGIMVLDDGDHIVTANRAALHLLNLGAAPANLDIASPELLEKYRYWLAHPLEDYASLDRVSSNRIQVRFTRFAAPSRNYAMIFLEDDALYNQRVQRSKLASLGRLTASIAHEVRNPLSAVTHAAQLLAEAPQLSPQDQRLTQIMLDNAARVNTVVENILQLSRRSPSRSITIDLCEWLQRFLVGFCQSRNLSASPFDYQALDASPRVIADPDQLQQILENLCDNALKYGNPECGKIIARIVRHPPDMRPCIEVQDCGPGILPKQAEQIFEPFHTSSPTGTGLGLYIARELAELNQARLNYAPSKTGGSCFRLCLRDAEEATVEL